MGEWSRVASTRFGERHPAQGQQTNHQHPRDDEAEHRVLPVRLAPLLTNVLNPKAGVFFVAILPQFITPRDDALAATLVFAVVDASASLLALTCYTALALATARALRRPAARRAIGQVTGGVLVLVGARLALESR